jgi:hypothetical protein
MRFDFLTGRATLVVGCCWMVSSGLAGQQPAGFDRAVEAARLAWLSHDVGALVESSDTIRLHLPGLGRAPHLRPMQAARILGDYLKRATEIDCELRSVRVVSDDHAYAELLRRYVVEGTTDQLEETVFLGFKGGPSGWGLREVRVTR